MSKKYGCPNCGCKEFYATQQVYADVIVDENNDFKRNLGEDNTLLVGNASDPYGPYRCFNCHKEYEFIPELNVVKFVINSIGEQVEFPNIDDAKEWANQKGLPYEVFSQKLNEETLRFVVSALSQRMIEDKSTKE